VIVVVLVLVVVVPAARKFAALRSLTIRSRPLRGLRSNFVFADS